MVQPKYLGEEQQTNPKSRRWEETIEARVETNDQMQTNCIRNQQTWRLIFRKDSQVQQNWANPEKERKKEVI